MGMLSTTGLRSNGRALSQRSPFAPATSMNLRFPALEPRPRPCSPVRQTPWTCSWRHSPRTRPFPGRESALVRCCRTWRNAACAAGLNDSPAPRTVFEMLPQVDAEHRQVDLVPRHHKRDLLVDELLSAGAIGSRGHVDYLAVPPLLHFEMCFLIVAGAVGCTAWSSRNRHGTPRTVAAVNA